MPADGMAEHGNRLVIASIVVLSAEGNIAHSCIGTDCIGIGHSAVLVAFNAPAQWC
jgi:hypothetical protein